MDPAKLAEFLNELAQRLTPAAEHVVELAVRQAVINGIALAVGAAVVLFVATAVAWMATKIEARNRAEQIVLVWFCAVLPLLGFACWLGYLAASDLINPEWQAIGLLIGLVP